MWLGYSSPTCNRHFSHFLNNDRAGGWEDPPSTRSRGLFPSGRKGHTQPGQSQAVAFCRHLERQPSPVQHLWEPRSFRVPCVCLSSPCVCLPCVCLPWVCLYAVSDQGFRPFFIWDLELGFQKLSQWCYQAPELKTKCSLAPDSCFLCGLGYPEAAQTGGSCRPLGSLTSLTPQMSDTGHLLCCQTRAIKYTSNEEALHHCSLPWGSGDVRPSSSGHGRALCTLTPLAHCTSAASCREPVSK